MSYSQSTEYWIEDTSDKKQVAVVYVNKWLIIIIVISCMISGLVIIWINTNSIRS